LAFYALNHFYNNQLFESRSMTIPEKSETIEGQCAPQIAKVSLTSQNFIGLENHHRLMTSMGCSRRNVGEMRVAKMNLVAPERSIMD
jgi:hypothetical protein